MDDLCDIEECFGINIAVYELDELERDCILPKDLDNLDQKMGDEPIVVARLAWRNLEYIS